MHVLVKHAKQFGLDFTIKLNRWFSCICLICVCKKLLRVNVVSMMLESLIEFIMHILNSIC